MSKLTNLCLLLLLAFSVFSCKEEITDPVEMEQPYEKGIFIVNEGPFGSGTGTISHFDKTTGTVTPKIFQLENDGQSLGNVVQSMYVHNGLAYIVVNNSDKIEVVDALTFKSVNTITGLEQPRYFLPLNNDRGFVSQWGADKLTGAVVVVDLNTFQIEKEIATGIGTEQMLIANNKLYAANKGFDIYEGYAIFPNPDSTLAVINLDNLELEQTISVGYNPSHLQLDKNGNIWALCTGNWNIPEFTGSIAIVENDAVKDQIPLVTGIGNLCKNTAGDKMFYTNNNQLLSIDVDDNNYLSNIVLQHSIYGVAIEPGTDNIFVADPKDYTLNGTAFIYDDQGSLVDSVSAGIAPNGFWFLN